MLDAKYNTECDVTTACYFHIVKMILLIISQCEIGGTVKTSLLFNELNPVFHGWKGNKQFLHSCADFKK